MHPALWHCVRMQELLGAKSCGFTEVLEHGHVSQRTQGKETLHRVCVAPHPQIPRASYQIMPNRFNTCIAQTCAVMTPDCRALD